MRIESCSGTCLFECAGGTLRDAAVQAVEANVSLTGAYLTRADLPRANLTDANLTGANLADANLTGANLTDANLTDANLFRANLPDANLTDANLTDANLTGAYLFRANLADANLTGANLTRANLTDANLTDANLTRANLTDANLTDANLTGANLTEATYDGKPLLAVQQCSGIGSQRRATILIVLPEETLIQCGCFRGTMDEFKAEIESTHANNPRCFAEYRAVVAFIEACANAARSEYETQVKSEQ